MNYTGKISYLHPTQNPVEGDVRRLPSKFSICNSPARLRVPRAFGPLAFPSPAIWSRFHRVLSAFALLLATLSTSLAQFIAFNDQAPGPATAANATAWNIFGNPPGAAGPLKDINSG